MDPVFYEIQATIYHYWKLLDQRDEYRVVLAALNKTVGPFLSSKDWEQWYSIKEPRDFPLCVLDGENVEHMNALVALAKELKEKYTQIAWFRK